ncbi:abortive infection family protein [uncultured Aliiroseovarius sp.]|uniref:abortive infection family protein n=1 Tax=uncultured Aliiroseovarius sp. TaxID=1658783 RepID=UPI00262F6407|nr:abortive infection family protein [uncultured Aliiroseovarius sp.]
MQARNSWLEQKHQLLSLGVADPEEVELQSAPHAIEEIEFEEFAIKIERMETDGSVHELHTIARKLSFDTVLDEVERAREFVDDDPEDAITASCSLIESVCKSILVELDLELPKKLTIKEVYRAVREPLGLSPSSDDPHDLIANDIRATLQGLTGVVEGIGALRSHGGDAHGRAKGSKRVDSRIARLAVNSASSVAIFLIQTWEQRFPNRELNNVEATQT